MLRHTMRHFTPNSLVVTYLVAMCSDETGCVAYCTETDQRADKIIMNSKRTIQMFQDLSASMMKKARALSVWS